MKTEELNKLKSIKNYATMNNVTTSYIYKLIKDKKMNAVVIDDVKFIDIEKHPSIHSK